jgi:hypothetical protein
MDISTALTAIPPGVTYDLYQRPGGKWLGRQLKDRGVRLTEDRIGWTSGDVDHEKSLSDIASIRLFGPPPPWGGGDFRSCKITFKDGTALFVLSCDRALEKSELHAESYRNFVTGLHRRLPASAAGTIKFNAGFPAGKYVVGWILFALVGMFVIGALLGLILDPLKDTYLGIVGMVCLFNLFYFNKFHLFAPRLLKNAPRTYEPAHIPDETMP